MICSEIRFYSSSPSKKLQFTRRSWKSNGSQENESNGEWFLLEEQGGPIKKESGEGSSCKTMIRLKSVDRGHNKNNQEIIVTAGRRRRPFFPPFGLNDTNAGGRIPLSDIRRVPVDRVPLKRNGRGGKGKGGGGRSAATGGGEACTKTVDRGWNDTACERTHGEKRILRLISPRRAWRWNRGGAKGRKGRRKGYIPMQRAPWHRYCISGTLQSPLPKPADYLPDIHHGYLPT